MENNREYNNAFKQQKATRTTKLGRQKHNGCAVQNKVNKQLDKENCLVIWKIPMANSDAIRKCKVHVSDCGHKDLKPQPQLTLR